MTNASSLRGAVTRLVEDLSEALAPMGLHASEVEHDKSQVRLALGDGTRVALELTVFSPRSSAQSYASNDELAFSYRLRDSEKENALTAWLEVAKTAILASRPVLAAVLAQEPVNWGLLRRMQLPRLVEEGHKPAAIVNVRAGSPEENELLAGAGAATGNQTFSESTAGKVTPGGQKRFVYLGGDMARAERLRDVDEALIFPPYADGDELRALRVEQGELLGFPGCCVAAYSQNHPKEEHVDEYYTAVSWLGWGKSPASPSVNFLAARLFGLAFFQHFPCSPNCAETIAATEGALARLACPATERAIRRLLGLSFVLWPDGTFLPFEWQGDSWRSTGSGHLGLLPYPTALVPSHSSKWLQEPLPLKGRIRVRRNRLEVDGRVTGPEAAEHPPLLIRFG